MSYSYSTIAGGNYTITLPANEGKEPPKTPPGLIATQAVQTKDGWLGQVIVDKEIVWESKLISYSDTAIKEANRKVVDVLRGLFTDEPRSGVLATVDDDD